MVRAGERVYIKCRRSVKKISWPALIVQKVFFFVFKDPPVEAKGVFASVTSL